MTENTENLQLYKKYRPSRWASLVGQEKVAKSLQTAVKANSVPTAYLFSGPRGCGKTSAAFVLAKALNCENLQKDENPCNKCETCQNIDAGAQMGVTYISMANYQGVDNVRELVKNARLNQPVKKQVWILDEVHNLSKQAFDALLIPLEEKTMPSLFIFCTTEIDRIPSTVLSRVQQRRFQLVEAETMKQFLEKVAKVDGLEVTDDMVASAVRMGRGSVRDTLTALEQVIATGEASSTYGGRLLEALGARDISDVLTVLAEANSESVDFRELAEQLFEDLRDLLLLASNVDRSLVGIPPITDEKAVIKGMFAARGILLIMDSLGDAITQMSMGKDARILLEVAMVKSVTTLLKLEKAIQNRA